MFDFSGRRSKKNDATQTAHSADEAATQACNLMESYQNSPSADRVPHLESAITLFESAINTYEKTGLATKGAIACSHLAKCYAILPNGNRATNLSKTVRYCFSALENLTAPDTQYTRATTLWVLANACLELPVGDHELNLQHSREYYLEALQFFTKSAYPFEFGMILNGLGVVYRQALSGDRKENLSNAVKCFEAVIEICTSLRRPDIGAKAHLNLGNVFATLVQIDSVQHLTDAIHHYESALTNISEHNAPLDWALLMGNLSNLLVQSPFGNRESNCARAVNCAENALRVLTEDAFPEDWAGAQRALGWAIMNQTMGTRPLHLQRAIECFNQAIKVQTEFSNPPAWAKNMQHLGAAFAKLTSGDRSAHQVRAVAYLTEALRVFTEARYPQEWGAVQKDLGTICTQLAVGERKQNLQLAITHFQAALRTVTEDVDPWAWAEIQANLGIAWEQLPIGDHHANLEQAIDCYRAALRVHTETAFPVDWAYRQSDLGIALQNSAKLGFPSDLLQAIDCYESSLRIFTQRDFPLSWASTQGNLGGAYIELAQVGENENIQRGIECHKRALEVYSQEEFPIDWAREHNNLGCAWMALSRTGELHWQEAIASFELALTVRTERDHPKDWATTMANLGAALSESSDGNHEPDFVPGADCFSAALRVRRPETMPFECAETLKNMLLLFVKSEKWEKALACCQQLIQVAEAVHRMALDDTGRHFVSRLFLHSIDQGARAAVNCGNYAAAFDLIESSKTRNLADQLWRHDVVPKGVASDQWRTYQELKEEARTLSKIAWDTREFSDKRASHHSGIEPGKVISERRRLKAALDGIQGQFAEIDPEYLPFSPKITLPEVASLAKSMDAVVVQLAVTFAGTYAFLCGPGDNELNADHVVVLPNLDFSSLHSFHMEWLETYYVRRSQWTGYFENAMERLYDRLVGPIHKRLQARYPSTKRLLIVPSKELHTFPLHAARWNTANGEKRYILDEYEVTYAPSCRVLRSCISRGFSGGRAANSIFAVQNPDGSLRFTDIEVELIQGFFDSANRKVVKGSAATVKAVMDSIQYGEEKLFSTHGLFDLGDADESHVVLYDGRLRVADIVRLDLTHAWLIVLSACESGRSDVMSSMLDEYYGLPAAFLVAGAQSVVASLWAVGDLSTALLMTRFHANIYERSLPKATALREAQLWLRDLRTEDIERFVLQLPNHLTQELNARGGTPATLLDKPFAHPERWSAFQCVGAGW